MAAYDGSEESEKWLDFLDKGGTTEEREKEKKTKNDFDEEDFDVRKTNGRNSLYQLSKEAK
ncbi:MAG: hypothetical protein HFG41_06285 [Coprococcus sp.]|nr:hypothetical protein [Coprococcus sp.]